MLVRTRPVGVTNQFISVCKRERFWNTSPNKHDHHESNICQFQSSDCSTTGRPSQWAAFCQASWDVSERFLLSGYLYFIYVNNMRYCEWESESCITLRGSPSEQDCTNWLQITSWEGSVNAGITKKCSCSVPPALFACSRHHKKAASNRPECAWTLQPSDGEAVCNLGTIKEGSLTAEWRKKRHALVLLNSFKSQNVLMIKCET